MPLTVQDLVAAGRVQAAVPSPDGTWIAVEVQRLDATKAKYVSDLWKVGVDGAPVQRLTEGDWKDGSPHFRPDGALYFLSNRASPKDKDAPEDERPAQIWLLRDGQAPELVTDEPNGVESFTVAKNADVVLALVSWFPSKPSEEQRAFLRERKKTGSSGRLYKSMPVRFWDHWLSDVVPHPVVYAAGQRTDLAPDVADGRFRETSMALSDDGRQAAVGHKVVAADRIHDEVVTLHEVATGRATATLEYPRASHDGLRFSPDGQSIATVRSIRTNEAPPRPTLMLWAPKNGGTRELARSWDRWPHLEDWDARGILVTADEEGGVPVFLVDPASGSIIRIVRATDGGAHQALTLTANGVVGIRHGLLQPPEVFTCPLAPDSQPTIRSTLSGLPTPQARIIDVEAKSTDGARVHGKVILPEGPGPHPTLFWIHGGPIGSFGDQWHWRWNPLVFVAQGYAVALPNARGSTGYGDAYTAGIWGNVWGAQCYTDLMAYADALERRPDIGALVAMGGSFGGYMSNWIGTQTDRFRAIVTHASVFSFSAFHGTTDFPAWWAHELGASPYDDFEAHERYSPMRFLSSWKTPTLVIHGERDYRCPIGEGLALYEGLQIHGVDSEMLVFPDENHWILKPPNIVRWYTEIARFLGERMATSDRLSP